jgi:hypothetical protein
LYTTYSRVNPQNPSQITFGARIIMLDDFDLVATPRPVEPSLLRMQRLKDAWIPRLVHEKAQVLREIQAETGVAIHPAENVTIEQLEMVICALLFRPETLPMGEFQHIVATHAYGEGEDWYVKGSTETVKAFVNRTVPQGETALVVACDTKVKRDFEMLSPEDWVPLVSQG